MRGFLNAVLALSVGGVALVGLIPIAVLSIELIEDPLAMGVICSISRQQDINLINVEAWYRGSIAITDINISIRYGGEILAWKSQDMLSRDRNVTLSVSIRKEILDPSIVEINIEAMLGNLYPAQMVVRGCGQYG
ncbi:MAG: hypothetical protein QXQ57_02340 [Sulfolobales archaeon]